MTWPRLATDGWAYFVGSTTAHYLAVLAELSDGTQLWSVMCGQVPHTSLAVRAAGRMTGKRLRGRPFAADPTVPRCGRCERALRKLQLEGYGMPPELWCLADGLTAAHYWRQAGRVFRSSCGVERSHLELLPDLKPLDPDELCKKCLSYEREGKADD